MRIVFAGLVGLAAVSVSDLPVYADRVSDTQESSGQTATSVPGPVDRNKPAKVKSNYQQPSLEPGAVGKAAKTEPIQLLPIRDSTSASLPNAARSIKAPVKRKARKKRKRRRSARKKARRSTSHRTWWNKTGNNLVFAFRDCAVEYASSQQVPIAAHNSRLLISKAMDEDCRNEFDSMAVQISGRFGNDKFRTLAPELITDIFLPAVISSAGNVLVSTNGG